MLRAAFEGATRLGVPITRLGGGTNLLISDLGIRGLVVRLGRAFDYRQWQPDANGGARVEVGAATRLGKLVSEAVELGWGGVEFAAGIPGTVGGGALMNAGAFGGELSSSIVGIAGVTLDGEAVSFDRSQLDFSYRNLALDVDVMVTSVTFSLRRASVAKLKGVVESVQAKRKRKQPSGLPNAGSIFKNPPDDYAGKLIELAGLKGKSVGKAQISPDHGNFIVNLGGARAADVAALMRIAQEAVWERSGIWLEPEVKLLGEWDEASAVPA
jgi:UDP-N-acetylmuramate dehydrogenase